MDLFGRLIGLESSPPTEIGTTEARQGVTGHNVRYVLAFGTAGVIIGFVVAYWAVRTLFGA